jgi:hypothetical protein
MRLKPALWLGIGTLVASAAAVNNARSGIYVLQTRTDRYVFWIDPVGTTLPYLLLGAVALLQLGRPKGTVAMAPLGGFIAGWSVMIAFTLFISSTPKHPELMRSSTIGIAIVLTPIV